MNRHDIIKAIKADLRRQSQDPRSTSPWVDFDIGGNDSPPTVKIDGDVAIGELADAILAALNP